MVFAPPPGEVGPASSAIFYSQGRRRLLQTGEIHKTSPSAAGQKANSTPFIRDTTRHSSGSRTVGEKPAKNLAPLARPRNPTHFVWQFVSAYLSYQKSSKLSAA